jgi:FlaA1/EpsC-like NDP-sugar epimerase
LDNNESALHDLHIELHRKLNFSNAHAVLADITSAADIKELFDTERPQVVFHAAAYKHVPLLERYPEEAVRVNIMGTMILSECAARFDAERFIFISTDKAVNPESVMGASKRVCEIWLRALNPIAGATIFTIVRFGNVLGSRGSVVPIFRRQIAWGGPLTVTHKDMTRFFMTIPEAVSLILYASTFCSPIDTYMLDMGERVSILDLAYRMIRLRGLRVHEDIGVDFIGIRQGEKLHEELYYGNELRYSTIHSRIYSLRDIESDINFKNILSAILLLADVAQRQGMHHILRRAILLAAYQDWDVFTKLMVDMGLVQSYQHPAALKDSSVLLDQNSVYNFIQAYSADEVPHQAD